MKNYEIHRRPSAFVFVLATGGGPTSGGPKQARGIGGRLRQEASFVREVGVCQVRRRRCENWGHRQGADLHHRALKFLSAVFGEGLEQCERRCRRNHGRCIVGSGCGDRECRAVHRVDGRLIELPNAACNGFRHAACNGFRNAARNEFRKRRGALARAHQRRVEAGPRYRRTVATGGELCL